jgi:hypothetical protein
MHWSPEEVELLCILAQVKIERMRMEPMKRDKEKELELRKWCVERARAVDNIDAVEEIYRFLTMSEEQLQFVRSLKKKRKVKK